MRASKEEHWKALKLGTFRLIDACGDGEAVAVTRVKAAALSKYKAMHEAENFIPIDVLFDLELVFGHPILTETLARLHGRKLVVDDAARAPGDAVACVRDRLDALEDDIARLRLTVREALGDARIDAAEKADIRRGIDQARRALSELEGML